MNLTRLSLYYLAGYLLFAGIALMTVPAFALGLLLSNGQYGDVLPRLLGVVLFALGVFVAQVIRHRVTVLYPTTLAVRAVILIVLAALYVKSSDPFFLVLIGIVGLGVVMTGTAYLRERGKAA
jgi:uncharacterized membrane protein YoaK (UPF0700 family)